MQIVGLIDKEDKNEIVSIAKMAVLANRVKVLAIKSLLEV